MAVVARAVLLPSIRSVGCAVLFRALRASHRLDRAAPPLAMAMRRAVLFVWWRIIPVLKRWLLGSPAPLPPPEVVHPRPADPSSLRLPRSASPLVTVIIPTYGQVAFTLRCLASIQEHAPQAPIEVLVVNDAWPGGDAAVLSAIPGIRLLRNEINLGFIRSCNAAARAALGTYILFLNNDTEVRAGWLDTLLEVFAAHPDTGIAGSKLISADGSLQEAGGIIWNDGSGWNFGRGARPDAPAFNYRREVDYCSGASILLRRDVFLDMGGFDERYAPAYCEDSDLSFRMRARGLRTRYQPRSEIVHYEGVTNGRDIGNGIKAYQVRNQAEFLRVWGGELARNHFPNGSHVLRAKDRARGRRVVLVVDHLIPEPDRDAGSRTMLAFMRALLADGCVVKFWPFNLHRTPEYTEALQDLGIEVFHGPDQVPLTAWLKTHGGDLDLVLLSRPDVAEMCLPPVRSFTRAPIVYYGHDLHFRRIRAQADLDGDAAGARAAEVMRSREMAVWRQSDIVLYPSEEEAATVRALAPAVNARPVVCYALGARPMPPRLPPSEPEILFVAGFGHPPNRDAAVWFVREVLPLILARVPAAYVSIVGSNPAQAVLALRGPRVALYANVTDAELAGCYRRARVAVVPLLAGAGVKRKTVETLWHGLPAVLTPVGAQGLPGLSEIVPVVSEAHAFADAVCALLEDDGLWQTQAAAQIGYAATRFSDEALRRSFLGALGFPAETCTEALVMA